MMSNLSICLLSITSTLLFCRLWSKLSVTAAQFAFLRLTGNSHGRQSDSTMSVQKNGALLAELMMEGSIYTRIDPKTGRTVFLAIRAGSASTEIILDHLRSAFADPAADSIVIVEYPQTGKRVRYAMPRKKESADDE